MSPGLRAMTLMALANKFCHLLLTTGNKSELAVGYCTLYGDMAGGLAVISDVPKTIVYELARWINSDYSQQSGRQGDPLSVAAATPGAPGTIPTSPLHKPPTAECKRKQKDTQQ